MSKNEMEDQKTQIQGSSQSSNTQVTNDKEDKHFAGLFKHASSQQNNDSSIKDKTNPEQSLNTQTQGSTQNNNFQVNNNDNTQVPNGGYLKLFTKKKPEERKPFEGLFQGHKRKDGKNFV